ncbi:MAG: beta-ketoacyl-ACP synthase III [Nitriliruptorales bacterium]|nr:beta-ketoacyl-ACP synthase III [Nitriliruptorales bacterium]
MTAVIQGLGTSVPAQVVTNDDLARTLDTSDAWIRSRTGIVQRHVAEPGVATSDLAVEAGAAALKSADNPEVDAVVLATMTPDRPCPATAPTVATRLGLASGMAFDVNAACSGFVYGLAVAGGLVSSGVAERALLVGADVMTRVVDPADRNTAVLFGDGAGAVVIGRGNEGDDGAIGPFDLGGNGELGDLLHIPAGGSRRPADEDTVAERDHFLRMDGKEVYRQAVAGMVVSCARLLAAAGLDIDDVDHLVAHQANARILAAVGDRLGLAEQRRVCNVDRYGNTTAASIPLALADLHRQGVRPGARILLTAFGAGLSWGSVLVRWPDLGRP